MQLIQAYVLWKATYYVYLSISFPKDRSVQGMLDSFLAEQSMESMKQLQTLHRRSPTEEGNVLLIFVNKI